MLNEVQEQWVQALESGEYEQCKGALRKEDKFCCLGVACDLYDSSRWGEPIPEKEGAISYDQSTFGNRKAIGNLPVVVKEHLNMKDDVGSISPTIWNNTECWSLAEMNDNGMSFKEIAKVIREHADEIFKEE